MTIPYVIILSDSEDEFDHTPDTIILSDSENESNYAAPGYMSEEEEESEEEDPEEEEPEEEESEEEDPEEEEPEEEEPEEEVESENTGHTIPETPPSPPPAPWTYFRGARTIHTARKRVAIPRRRVTLTPEPEIPTTDPYLSHEHVPTTHRRVDARKWTWLPETLQQWRQEEGFPTVTEVGESSSAWQEYPLTRELLVARMHRQEHMMDQMKDNINEMPGEEAIEQVQCEVNSLEGHLVEVREEVNNMREMMTGSTRRTGDLERMMDHLEHSMEQLQTLADTMRGYAAYILGGDHTPKKSG